MDVTEEKEKKKDVQLHVIFGEVRTLISMTVVFLAALHGTKFR